jgi:hypothetical protein
MLFTSKSNTNATTNTTATETTETTNNNGGLLKGLAIGIGTVAGIGLAAFGGTKAYKHFHIKDENRLDDVTDNETPAENAKDTTNEATVESFNEVDTEEPANEAPVTVEEAKTEETVDETTTEAEEAKVEETKETCWDAFKDPKEAAPAEDKESKAEETKKPEPKETVTMKFERMLGEAVSRIPYDKPESVDLAFYIRCVGGYLHEIDMDDAGNTGRFVIAEHCIAMTDLVSKAIIHIGSTNISDLEEYHVAYGDIKRLTKEFKASNIMDFTQKPELCKEKFEETLGMVEKNLTLTKQILKLKEAKPASKSAGENQTADKVEGETKTSTTESPNETKVGNSTVVSDNGETVTLKAEVSQDSIDNVNAVIRILTLLPNREHPERNNMPYIIRTIGKHINGITEPKATFLAYDETSKSNKFMDACVDACNLVGTGICNITKNGKDPITSICWINNCVDELFASGIIDNTYNPDAYRAAILKAREEATDALSKRVTPEIMAKHNRSAKKQVSNENQVDATKVTGETKTVTNEKLIDEINTYLNAINSMAFKHFTMVSTDTFVEKLHKIDEFMTSLDDSKPSKAIKRTAYRHINVAVRLFCTSKLEDIDVCVDRNDIDELCTDVKAMASLNLTNVIITDDTSSEINRAITSAQNKADVIASKHENQGLEKSSDETQAEDTLTYTMSDKIKEAVQQADETAATAEPESKAHVLMSPGASEMARKLQEAGELIRAKKWSDASEFYKTQLTPYLADDKLTDELREEIMSIKTKATNMLMSQKQLEAKQKAASAKASKKSSKKNKQRRRH